ncbi:Homeodomain-like superfamily protein [Striga hermonthica]|uniref:Homeodomain-like superfamily protein n=1 Tax=Striga hermonthica TaxID=68872 RepID=A0A9N7R1K6_STRHE|nr:Homeodomain-like superfamily protein [Striga hermonthica]
MEDEHNGAYSQEMHSEDDNTLRENNKKRTVKTHTQLQTLEKFYNEHKYLTESMKAQLAGQICLTEKQVSEWFCHRRLKDKRLANLQDSCGSTKQVENRKLDIREFESERSTLEEYKLAQEQDNGRCFGTNYHMDDASSGSSSSLRNMANNGKGSPFDMARSRQRVPKFPSDMTGLNNPRLGPAGYLKVKARVENAAITAVKMQLGKHCREDGPPLGVEFDPLPPGAFELSMQNPDDRETFYTEEPVPPASPDISKFHHYSKSGKGHEYTSKVTSNNPNMNGTSFKVPQMSEIPDNYVHQSYEENTNLSNNGACYPQRDIFEEFPEVSPREMKYKNGAQVMKMSTFSSSRCVGNLRKEQESSFSTFCNLPRNDYKQEIIGNESPNLVEKGFEQMQPKRIAKDGKTHSDRRLESENQILVRDKHDRNDLKRMRNECPQQSHLKRSSMVARSVESIPTGISEDETSAETSSSVE